METPTIIQFDYTECGPVALGIVLAYYGHPVSIAELCDACEVDQNGSTAGRLLRVARQYGLEAKALRQAPEQAKENRTPFIAHWQENHFLVIEGFGDGVVAVNDPAFGRQTIPAEEFAVGFSGVALLLEPAASPAVSGYELPSRIAHDALFKELARGLRGPIGRLPHQLAEYQLDFGRLRIRTPRLVVKTLCEEDIVHTLAIASRASLPVTTRGGGHTRDGQALSEGGILLVNYLEAGATQFERLDENLVEVSAGTRWGALEQELNRIGRSMPVVPGYENLSVGGTLSIGGFGERSIQYGSQIHHVRRLRMVSAEGNPYWCSANENPDLFRFSLAGLGQLGVIEKVVMETIPYQEPGPYHYYRHESREAFLEGLSRLLEEPAEHLSNFVAFILKDKGYFSECRRPEGVKNLPPVRAVEIPARPAFRGQDTEIEGFRLAVDYLFDFEGLGEYLHFLEHLWRTTLLGCYMDWALLLVARQVDSAVSFPMEPVPTSRPPVAFLVGLHPTIPTDDPEGLALVKKIFRQTLAKCLELGGRPYLYGSHELDEPTLITLYGEGYRQLKALRQIHNPNRLLNGHIL